MSGKPMLVIVPCGKSKIWDRNPNWGPVAAADAYTGNLFRLNRQYAERFGDAWLVPSAKYGFVSPDFPIPGSYNVTFRRPATEPMPRDRLRQQVREQQLSRFQTIVGLGGKEYRDAVREAFAGLQVRLVFPFAGLSSQGQMQQMTKRAIVSGDPGLEIAETPNDGPD